MVRSCFPAGLITVPGCPAVIFLGGALRYVAEYSVAIYFPVSIESIRNPRSMDALDLFHAQDSVLRLTATTSLGNHPP